jgi:hypothetical protein
MNTGTRTIIALVVATSCAAAVTVRGGREMAVAVTFSTAAMCIASAAIGFVLRRRWHFTLWCMWLVAVQAWVLGFASDMGSLASAPSELRCSDLMTLCSVVLLAGSLIVVRPCHQFGAGMRKMLAERPRIAHVEVGQLA